MIGKIPKAGRSFKGLIRYLLEGPKRQDATASHVVDATASKPTQPARNRVAWVATANLVVTDPLQAARVMRATARRSTRCKAPVYHFVVSFAADEDVDEALQRQIVAETCRALGLGEHQRVVVAHDDTQHKHVHVVVNRVEADTGRAWNRRQDWMRLETVLAVQARRLGLRYVPGRHTEPERFQGKPRRVTDGAYQQQHRTRSAKQLPRWDLSRVQHERAALLADFENSTSWDALHAALRARGYVLRRKGQGLVLSDEHSELKLSQLGKTARLSALETRFAASFYAADIQLGKRQLQQEKIISENAESSSRYDPFALYYETSGKSPKKHRRLQKR